jgi:hypothetical protein
MTFIRYTQNQKIGKPSKLWIIFWNSP